VPTVEIRDLTQRRPQQFMRHGRPLVERNSKRLPPNSEF
jgi:hypothetical protein